MLDLHYGALFEGIARTGTHRCTLFALIEGAITETGLNLIWGTEISQVETSNAIHTLIDIDSNRFGPFDLLLVCDGSSSALREQIRPSYSHNQYPWGALWFIGKRSDAFLPNQLWQSVSSTDKLCGFLPTGTDDDLLSLFWSIRMDKVDDWRATHLDAWKQSVIELAPHAEEFLQQIRSHDDLSASA